LKREGGLRDGDSAEGGRVEPTGAGCEIGGMDVGLVAIKGRS